MTAQIRTTEAEAIEKYRPYVFKVAKKYAQSTEMLADLVQEGLIAIVTAHRKWKKSGGASELTWSVRPIFWAIKRYADAYCRNGTGRNPKTPKMSHVSMDALRQPNADGDEYTLHDVIGTFEEPPDFLALSRLPALVAGLPDVERQIIRLRFIEGRTLDQTSRQLVISSRRNMTIERIRQIEERAIQRMRRRLLGSEDRPS